MSVADGGPLQLPLAGGVRAGPWVFVSGLLPRDLGNAGRPRSGEAPWLTQAKSIWSGAAEVLKAGGSDVSRIVRCDQFFEDWRAVPFFHQARRAACGSYIAPSTSILQPQTLVPGAVMMTDMIAVASDGPAIEPIFPKGLDTPSTSSFVPVVKAGSLVFVAGFLAASGPGDLDGVAKEAKVPEGHLWKGNRIQLEAGYVIREKLVPALEGAGLGLADVVKANVFLRDIEDVPAFNQVWSDAFGGDRPRPRSRRPAIRASRSRTPGSRSISSPAPSAPRSRASKPDARPMPCATAIRSRSKRATCCCSPACWPPIATASCRRRGSPSGTATWPPASKRRWTI